MLTICTCHDYGHALGQYLRQADYYSEGLRVEGICFGGACGEVGLRVGSVVTDQEFEALAQNNHPRTGERLTARMAAQRRAGFDCVFSAPKSVSIQAFIGGDERLVLAHDRSVEIATSELERFACQQVGQGINKRYVRTGNIAGARFRHGENRELDPQLHTHEFAFNFTRASDGCLVALETSEIFSRTRYLTEVYRNALASEIRSLGYSITKTKHGFEIDGVSRDLIDRFSKRTKIRDAAVATREREIGRKLTNNEVAVVVRESRPDKLSKLSPADVRRHQLSQVTEMELGSLRKLRDAASEPLVLGAVSISETIEQAKEHIFERRTVVDEHELMAEVIRAGYGENPLAEIRAAVSPGKHGLLVVDGLVSTLEAIEHERALIESINSGIGREGALGRMPVAGALSDEQRWAAQKVLENRDTVQVFRGRAGTGKTTSLAHIIEGCAEAGRGVACFAPSSKSVDVLRADGAEQNSRGFGASALALGESNTVQRLLLDPEMKAAVAGKVLVVDEYGLLSSRDLKRLVDLVEKQESRLLLVGDSMQHSSVESGSAARIIEKETRISIAEIKEIRRQSPNKGYLRAAQALAAGDLRKGLSVLDDIGAVVEIADDGKRRAAMVSEWFNAAHAKEPGSRKGIRALMIAPTWNEIDALNLVARERLRVAGMLQGEDHEFVSLWRRDWTRAQIKEARNYEPGLILVARKRTKQFEKGVELEVVRKDGDRVIARDRRGRELSVSPRQTGTAWTVCDGRPILLAKGDQVRLRAVGLVRAKSGIVHRISNGTTFMIAGVGRDGNVRLEDGSTLLSRELVHAYATTSHGAQGLTASAVFMTDPLSREGLYVSATRGRETIKVFTSDKVSLLAAARLRSEDRTSATEFARQAGIKVSGNLMGKRRETLHDLKAMMARGAELGRSFAVLCLQVLNPWWARRRTETIRAELRRGDSLKPEASFR